MSLVKDLKKEFRKKKILFNDGDPRWMYYCQWWDTAFPVLAVRLLAAVTCLTSLVLAVVRSGWRSFTFLTIWSFTLITLYFSIASIVSVIHIVKDKRNIKDRALTSPSTEMSRREIISTISHQTTSQNLTSMEVNSYVENYRTNIPWYMVIQWALHNITLPVALLVTITYWAVLYPQRASTGYKTDFLDVSTHGLNSIFMVAETILNTIPVNLLHVYQPLAFVTTYTIFSAVLWSINGRILYPFVLDWNRPMYTAVSLTGSLVYFIFVQFILFFISRAKQKCKSKAYFLSQKE